MTLQTNGQRLSKYLEGMVQAELLEKVSTHEKGWSRLFLFFFLTGFLRSQPILAASINETGEGEKQSLRIHTIGTKTPSSFSTFVAMKVVNRSTTTWDLVMAYAGSQIIVDGQSTTRLRWRWGGISSIHPGEVWRTCLQLEDYEPRITPGPHKVRLKFGPLESNEISLNWSAPKSTATLTVVERRNEVRELAAAVGEDRATRRCVDKWFWNKVHDPDPSVQQAAIEVLRKWGIYRD